MPIFTNLIWPISAIFFFICSIQAQYLRRDVFPNPHDSFLNNQITYSDILFLGYEIGRAHV